MATIINNPAPTERTTTIERTEDSSAGWAVAVVVLLIVLAAGTYLWVHYQRAARPNTPSGTTNINLTVPTPAVNSGASGSAGGTSNTAPRTQ